VEYAGRSEELLRVLAYDPQTSGGLLLLAPEAEADVLVSKIEGARVVGRARQKGPRPLVFRA
jgi:hypothetical protein